MNAIVRQLREGLGLSQSDLAELAGTSQPQIARLEKGDRKLSIDWAKKLAPALGTSIEVLLKLTDSQSLPDRAKNGPSGTVADRLLPETYRPPPRLMNDQDLLKVYASAEGGRGELIISTEEIERVPRPYTLEGIDDAYGILITGESMVPAYKPGDIAWVNPRLPAQRDTECIFYSVQDELGEARATIKNLLSWTDAEWKVEQYNPSHKFALPKSVWNKRHRVVGNFRRR